MGVPESSSFVKLSSLILIMLLCMNAKSETPSRPVKYEIFSATGQQQTYDDMIQTVEKSDIIFIGETHDNPVAHALELKVLESLFKVQNSIALSMEMFSCDVQPVVDEYLNGFISEKQFLADARPWPNYQEAYRPLIMFCKSNSIPVLAANVPRRYVNLVSREGMKSLLNLPEESRKFLPPIPYSMDIPSGYKQELDSIFGMPHDEAVEKEMHKSASSMPTTTHMIEAQALWDDAMAHAISKFHTLHPTLKILQINGEMHSDHGWGIVDRLRRLQPKLRITILSVQPSEVWPISKSPSVNGVADYLILTVPVTKRS